MCGCTSTVPRGDECLDVAKVYGNRYQNAAVSGFDMQILVSTANPDPVLGTGLILPTM